MAGEGCGGGERVGGESGEVGAEGGGLFEGGVEDGVLGGSVRVARSDVELETNHRGGIRKIEGDFLCCAQFGYKRNLETAGKTVGFISSKIRHGCDKRGLYRT